MMHILKIIEMHLWLPIFLTASATGVLLIPLRLPGLWVQFAAAFLASILPGFLAMAHLPWLATVIVFLLAAGGEFVDGVLGNMGFERSKASSMAAWFSFFGGVIFGFFGTLIPIPIPVLGSLIGSAIMSFIGIFACAILGEWIYRKRSAKKDATANTLAHFKPALTVGMKAVVWHGLGIAAKLWFAFLAFGVVLIGLLWELIAQK